MSKNTLAPVEEQHAKSADQVPPLPFIWDFTFRPEEAATTLLKFTAGAFDLSDPENAEAIVKAWEALSLVVAESYDIAVEASRLAARILQQQHLDEDDILSDMLDAPRTSPNPPTPIARQALKVATFALRFTRKEETGQLGWLEYNDSEWPPADPVRMRCNDLVRKMAALLDPLGSSEPTTRLRRAIGTIVDWSASEEANPRTDLLEDEEAQNGVLELDVSDEEWRARRADFLRVELAKLDPRLALDEGTARTLVRLFKHKNGTQKLAANWAWRAGIEGPARAGESLTDDAPDRVVDRYREIAKKTRRRLAR